jgi:hypothetical protein
MRSSRTGGDADSVGKGIGRTSAWRPSGPAIRDRQRRRSAIERAKGPYTPICRTLPLGVMPGMCQSGMCPVEGTRCSVGLSPYIPQKCAGTRIEPPMSLPTSSGERPAATAAALPPLLPPQVRVWSHGFVVRPNTGLFVCQSVARSARFDLPMMMAPAPRKRATTVASSVGT